MEKRKLHLKMLLVALTAVLSLFAFAGCKNEKAAEPAAEPEQLPDYQLYWNVDRDSFDGSASRQKEADGTYLVRMFADGRLVNCKVADRSKVGSMDKDYLVGLVFDENGFVSQVLDVDELDVEQLGRKFYVQSVEGTTVHTNSSYRFDGMEESFEISDATGIYDMTGVSGEPGTETVLQENDRIIAVGDGQGVATAVYVYGRQGINSRINRYCEQCKAEVSWSNWYHEDNLPVASGHYYLVNDVQLSAQKTIPENETICLDLNGYTVTGGENARIYSMHYEGITLSIFDYSENQTGKLVGWGQSCPQGACVWVRFGTFNLYGGTLDGSGAVSNVNGVAVAVPKNAVMNMYGGTIIGGKTNYAINKTTGAAQNSMGGSISVAGTFDMYGGTIRDGYATCYYNRNKGTYSQGYGGNVLVIGGTFTMHGGIIENGKAEGGGGNVYVTVKGTFHMKGGTLSGGQVLKKGKNGGNLVVGTNCTFTMSGGTITGGVSYNYAGNIHMMGTMSMSGGLITGGRILDINTGKVKDDHTAKNMFLVNGKMTMSGGTIAGYMTVTDSKKNDGVKPYLCLSGTAKITGAKEGHNNLQLNTGNDGYSLDVKKLYSGANIGVSASGKFTNETSQSNGAYFVSDVGGQISYVDGCLFVGRLACLCGAAEGEVHIGQCDGTLIPWQAWGKDASLPIGDGYYYLTKDVATNQNGVKAGAHVHLDLNGKTVTAEDGSRIYTTFNEDSHLTVTDSSENHTGKLVTTAESTAQGLGVWVRYGSFTLYRGTLDASKSATTMSGVAVCVDKNAEFTMYGGTILGGTALLNSSGQYGSSGSVHVSGTFHLVDGIVANGLSTSHGGNISVMSGARFNMSGGKVMGGMNLEGGKSGGNIYIAGGAVMNLSGGTVSGGLTKNIGGNIYGAGTLNMSGGTVTGGMRYTQAEDGTVTTTQFPGGNVQLVGGRLEMSGGLIEGYVTMTSYNDSITTILLSGSPRLVGGEKGVDLSLVQSGTAVALPVVEIEGVLSDDAMIGITNTGFFSGETTPDNADNFVAQSGIPVAYVDGKLAVGLKQGCVCGTHTDVHTVNCPQEQVLWKAWTSATSLPSGEGYYYLVGDVTPAARTTVTAGKSLYLDLNGYTVDATTAVYFLNAADTNLTITDSSEAQTGTIKSSAAIKDNGILINVNTSGASLTLFAGTLDASGVTNARNGAAVNATGSFTMNGGHLIGGQAENGGVLRSLTQFTVNGGTITGGTATLGDAAYLGSNANTVITGGTINGSIYSLAKSLTVSQTAQASLVILAPGKLLTVGMLTEGASIGIQLDENKAGAVAVAAEGVTLADMQQYLHKENENLQWQELDGKLWLMPYTCKVCGGVYEGCEHTEKVLWTPVTDDIGVILAGGNYFLTKDLTVSGQISIGANANITLDLNGCTLSRNGRVLAMNQAANLTITDTVGTGSIKSVTATKDNGMVLNINNASAVVTMYAGTLDGSEVTNANNGAVVNVAGNLKLYGGTILGGQAVNGGALRVVGSGVLEMYGGLIYGGKASSLGDNVYLAGSKTSTLSGGQIAGGVHFASGGLKVAGSVVIDKSLTAQLDETLYVPVYGLRLTGTKTVDAAPGLEEGAKISITLSGTNNKVATNVADETQTAYFCLDDQACIRTYDPDAKTLTLTEALENEETV